MVADLGELMNKTLLSSLLAGLIGLTFYGCSSAPPEPAKQAEAPKKEPPKPVSGQTALFNMYKVARTWNSDAKVLKVENIDVDGVTPEPGKYGAWRATFISESRSARRDYTYSVSDASATVTEGVRAGADASYTRSRQSSPFMIQDVKIDTTAALEEALKNKDIKAMADKNPDLPVIYQLEWTPQTIRPAWRVIWGATVSSSVGSAYIDAVDGKFIRKAR
jgi:hypothetical protein